MKKGDEVRWFFKNFSANYLHNNVLKIAAMRWFYVRNALKRADFSNGSPHFQNFLGLPESRTLLYCLFVVIQSPELLVPKTLILYFDFRLYFFCKKHAEK